MKGNQQDIATWSTKQCYKIQRFCEEILSVLLHTSVTLILVLKSWIYLIFLAICRTNPSVLWIREQRVREMSQLRLGDSCRISRGTETLNESALKGFVSTVIWKLPNVCFMHVGLHRLEFMVRTHLRWVTEYDKLKHIAKKHPKLPRDLHKNID